MIKNDEANSTKSSLISEKKLRLDFYESGIGDTIVVTFPDGGIGVIDAHPSSSKSRPDIQEIVKGKKLHFVCMTHPHADHGVDLIPILRGDESVGEFWHTHSDIALFIYRLSEMTNWRSEVRDFARKMGSGWAHFNIDLYSAVVDKSVPVHQVVAGQEPREYGGVVVHSLAPEEAIVQEIAGYWVKKAGKPDSKKPDPNRMSAVFALQWGKSVVVLGGDALRENWFTATNRYFKLKLPKASVLKVPHHGARNSLQMPSTSKRHSYLDICHHAEKSCCAVLFSGDVDHPNKSVYERLRSRTELFCLGNGLNAHALAPKDLGIEIEGARPIAGVIPCQPVVSFELDQDGTSTVVAGRSCAHCTNCAYQPPGP